MRLRKNHADAEHGTSGGVGSRRPGPSRGWGPFSGAQLAAIILGAIFAIAFPVTAFAVVDSNVAITDPAGVNQAKVNNVGQLWVNATPSPPSNSYNVQTSALEATGCNSATPTVPAGKALIVLSITVDVTNVTTGPVLVTPVPAVPGSPCLVLGSNADVSQVSGAGVTENINFPQGYPIAPGHVLGFALSSLSGDAGAFVTVKGYLTASTLCTLTGPPQGCH